MAARQHYKKHDFVRPRVQLHIQRSKLLLTLFSGVSVCLFLWSLLSERSQEDSMARSMLSKATATAAAILAAQTALGQATTASSQSATVGTVTISGVASTYSVQYTPPAAVDNGQPIIPNIDDPQAVDAQTVCPGYKASNVGHTSNGFTADLTLAGQAVSVISRSRRVLLTLPVQCLRHRYR